MTQDTGATAGTPTEDPAEGTDWLADPQYRAAVVDLLGVLAYGELSAFTRLAGDSELAPSQPLKAAVAGLAVAEFRHYELLVARLQEMGVDPESAMAPFIRAVDAFHERTRPSTWLEGLVKAYVGDGIAIDFYREISAYVDPSTQALVHDAMQDVGQAEFVVKVVREAIAADERVAGPARSVGPAPGRRGALAGAAGGGRARRPLLAAGRRGRRCPPAERRPRRARPDVRPPHRRAHPADGPPRPRRLTTADAKGPRPGGRGPFGMTESDVRACGSRMAL